MAFFWSSTPSARIKRLWSTVVHSFYLDRAPADATIFVCGSPRSGTTWLTEVLNYDNRYRHIGEPFTAGQVPISNHFALRQYLYPNDDDPRYLEPARAIFAGHIRAAYSDSVNRSIFPKGRFVKDVRTTLLLGWFRVHFPKMPIVYLMRHPYSVAASRVRLGYRTDMGQMYLRQPALVADHLAPFVELINEPKTPFACHVLDWCVENFVPIHELEPGDIIWVFYELLCSTEDELPKLFAELGRPVTDDLQKRLHKPSMSTLAKGRSDSFFAAGAALDGWRHHVAADDLAAGQRITQAFGLDQIYGDETLPNVEKAHNLLREKAKKKPT
jgi:Sulfotransferase family